MADNPKQYQIAGYDAWYIDRTLGVERATPAYGVWYAGFYVTADKLWLHQNGKFNDLSSSKVGAVGPALIRLMLDAKAGWDNERKNLTGRVALLEDCLAETLRYLSVVTSGEVEEDKKLTDAFVSHAKQILGVVPE